MTPLLLQALRYALFPIVAMIAGGAVTSFYVPGQKIGNAVQHFTAGVVVAAISVELLPSIVREHSPVAVVIGFTVGVLAMFAVRALTEKLNPEEEHAEGHEREAFESEHKARSPVALIAAVGVDAIMDGLLIGIGLAAGQKAGALITVALTLEMLFLGLALSGALSKAAIPRGKAIAIIAGCALFLAVGAGVGAGLLGGLRGFGLELVLSFGCASLLYLVTEELLLEAHKTPETRLTTITFFVGFLLMVVLDMIS